MKSVMFTKNMRPYHQGQRVPLPDEVADKQVAEGSAIDPRPWPDNAPLEPVEKPKRPILGTKGYNTRKAG